MEAEGGEEEEDEGETERERSLLFLFPFLAPSPPSILPSSSLRYKVFFFPFVGFDLFADQVVFEPAGGSLIVELCFFFFFDVFVMDGSGLLSSVMFFGM